MAIKSKKRARVISKKAQTTQFIELLFGNTWAVYHIGDREKRELYMRLIVLIERTENTSDTFSNLDAITGYTYMVKEIMEGQHGESFNLIAFNEPPVAVDENAKQCQAYWNSINEVVSCFREKRDIEPETLRVFNEAVPPQILEDWTVLQPIRDDGGRVEMSFYKLFERKVDPDVLMSNYYESMDV